MQWVLVAAFWLVLWQAAAMAVGQELLLASPLAVLARLWELLRTAAFWQTVVASTGRILLGFSAGMCAGSLLAAATYRSRLCYALFYPAIRTINATPVASFILLALVWFTSARVPSFTAFLIILPVFWQNVHDGLAQVDRSLLEMAHAYRFGPGRTLRLVYLPAALPGFAAACSAGMGMAWKAAVAAEVLANTALSIGANLQDAKVYLETRDLFAWTVPVVLMSVLLEKLLRYLLRLLSEACGARGILCK